MSSEYQAFYTQSTVGTTEKLKAYLKSPSIQHHLKEAFRKEKLKASCEENTISSDNSYDLALLHSLHRFLLQVNGNCVKGLRS